MFQASVKTSRTWVQLLKLSLPSLKDNTADADRLIQALKSRLSADDITVDLDLLKTLPDILRNADYHIRCVLYKDRGCWGISSILGVEDPAPVLGMAVDLGTTRVVLRLVDLADGRALAESSFDNPQLSVGPDILTRIHYADSPEGQLHLQNLIVDGLNREMAELCASGGFAATDVFLMAIAGNTAMTHLLMGLNPRWIIREPYIPVVNRPGTHRAAQFGLCANAGARVFVFPNIGSYFGGDLIAGILYSGLNLREETAILVDVGTNAEVVLGNKNWMIACAGAAGPALEGGAARMGMMAGPGVIDRVAIDPETRQMDIHTIEELSPVGICGSGLIDLAAHLFLCGMLDIRGKFVASACGSRLKEIDGLKHLVVVNQKDSATGRDLSISQADIDSLIRSKAAMYTILETLAASVGMAPPELTRFYVAGTFGSFINPVSAISIGMIPDLPLSSYQTLGNSSLGGAARFLESSESFEEIDRIQGSITYLELNVNQDFMNRFSAAKFLPHTDPSLFPSVKIKTM
ncbi:MAG: DUF4445 domain-containing protein [Deltaproteobacteria bacterium]|nr:DUF4445 domain-containing protein [Deltaproteobacteria bacterium]